MKPEKDIYDHDRSLKRIIQRINRAFISEKNKDLIRDFDRACFLEGLSKTRRIKLMISLLILAREYLKKDFDKATKDNLKDVVIEIDGRDDYSPWTKHGYKAIIKKFYKWLHFGDDYNNQTEYPREVAWLKAGMSNKDKPKVKASDILTEVEVKRLIDAAEHPRDKAFVSMLYELGARIGEIGGIYVNELTRDKYGFIIDLEGKTGHRTPRIVSSDPHITHWLNIHPLRDKPNPPLWVMIGKREKGKRMKYSAFRALILRLVAKAGIKKRISHKLFRHTRVTHLLINKQINEAQAKVYFGWVPNSTMLSEYSHLISNDVNEAILAMHGIKTGKHDESLFKPKQCPRCSAINSKDARFCQKCSSILDVNTALELDEKRSKGDEIINKLAENPEMRKLLAKMIIDMGMKDKILGE